MATDTIVSQIEPEPAQSALSPLPSLARIEARAASQGRPDPAAPLLTLLARPGVVVLSGTPELATLAGIYLSVRMAAAGRRVVYSDLVENAIIGRLLWATGRVNVLQPGKRLAVNRDPIALNRAEAPQKIVSLFREDKPKLWLIDSLAAALVDPAQWTLAKHNPGHIAAIHDPDQAALTLLHVVEELRIAVLVLAGAGPSAVDGIADARLAVSRVGRVVTLSVTHAPGAIPAPIQFELVRAGDVAALKLAEIHNQL
jgi:hypothetical protein